LSDTASLCSVLSKAAWKASTTFDLVKPGGAGNGGGGEGGGKGCIVPPGSLLAS
jgi:hypothetical protein